MYSRREFLKGAFIGGISLTLFKKDALAIISKASKNIPKNISPEKLSANEDFWNSVQSAFEVDRTFINLNNGGVSPSPSIVLNNQKDYIDFTNRLPAYNLWRYLEPNVETVRARLAKSFGCLRSEVAITRNTSEAMEIIQNGIDLKPGDEVLTTIQDYPRMLATFDQRARREGITVNKISFPVPLKNFNVLVNRLEKAITPKTKLLLVSHVVYLTGQILPVREISRMAHEKGVLVLCDGAHSFNHFPFKLKDLECDFFGTSLHKWTHAPIGTGFLYVRKDLIEKVWPLMGAPKKLDNNIKKFEQIGTHPAAAHNAVAEALAFNEKLGLERKIARLRYLNLRWINRVKNYKNVSFSVNVEDPSQWGALVGVNIKGIDVRKLADYLFKRHKILVLPIRHKAFRGIRVSPSIYTQISEIDYFADVLEKVVNNEIKSVLK